MHVPGIAAIKHAKSIFPPLLKKGRKVRSAYKHTKSVNKETCENNYVGLALASCAFASGAGLMLPHLVLG